MSVFEEYGTFNEQIDMEERVLFCFDFLIEHRQF